MKLSMLSKENLKRDRRVLGKGWQTVYGNYFSNKRVTSAFISASKPFLHRLPGNAAVLYVCSGTGLLGESVCAYLRKIGKTPTLTIVDASPDQLRQNKHPLTQKIRQDALFLDLGRKFDLIIMRSSLDYFPTKQLQTKVLARVRRHLNPGGVFINQCAAFPSLQERNIADAIYASTPKIGRRHFQCPSEVPQLYDRAGLKARLIGNAPSLKLTHQDHCTRYGLTDAEVEKIRGVIRSAPKTPNIRPTGKGYVINCTFPIYAARLEFEKGVNA